MREIVKTHLTEMREESIRIDGSVQVLQKFLVSSYGDCWIIVVQTLMKRLQGSMSPLWLDDPGPLSGANCTCWPGPCMKESGLRGGMYGEPRGGEYCQGHKHRISNEKSAMLT